MREPMSCRCFLPTGEVQEHALAVMETIRTALEPLMPAEKRMFLLAFNGIPAGRGAALEQPNLGRGGVVISPGDGRIDIFRPDRLGRWNRRARLHRDDVAANGLLRLATAHALAAAGGDGDGFGCFRIDRHRAPQNGARLWLFLARSLAVRVAAVRAKKLDAEPAGRAADGVPGAPELLGYVTTRHPCSGIFRQQALFVGGPGAHGCTEFLPAGGEEVTPAGISVARGEEGDEWG